MNPAFEDALAARLLWGKYIVLARIEGCEEQAEQAEQAAIDAVHDLASNDVLKLRHYGPHAPVILQFVPHLADQYNMAHEHYTEAYYENFHKGFIGSIQADWLAPVKPLELPYTKWLVAVDQYIAEQLGGSLEDAGVVSYSQPRALMGAWSDRLAPEAAGAAVLAEYRAKQGHVGLADLAADWEC
ncbi:hypothetical protein [Pseudomonas nitroreducens]|uniref:hypothetical protein n=1 Tax=Pseudomonas nitroreducens TaxID=46680 RepID=UPI00351DA6E1